MRKIILFFSILFLWTCGGGGGDKATGPEEPPIVINLTSLTGQAQKGPFNNGTAINIAELTSALSPTGRNFSSAITDNTGRFSVANVQLESPYVELRANGFYFNEVSNEISDAQLTLFAISNLTGKTSLNVNILTHLEKNRMVTLMSGDSPKTFAQAKLQAQEEVFAVFDYSRANVPESELLDISQGGAANGKLLAMSAIIQGDLTVGQMSQLLANISTDIASDGTLDDASLRATLTNNSKNLDMAAVRSNLVAHYSSLGISATIPDFETEINQFLKPPVSQDMSASTAEDTAINITLAGSDPEGESLTYTILEVNNATVTLSGNVANYLPDTNFNGTDTFTYYANDGTSDSNVATVTMTVSGEDDEPNTNDVSTTTDEDVAVAINLTADEYDGQNYSFGIIDNPSNGTVSLSGTTATYTPNQDWNGTDTFTFEATDDRIMFGKRNVATATITVNAINDAPTSSEVSGSSDEDTAIDIALSATDVDQDNLTYSIVSDVSNGTTSISGSTLTYTPNENWNGTDTFTYKVNDGTVDSNTSNGTITIASINDIPIANDMTVSTNETRFISLDITLDVTDADGDALTYSIESNVSDGTATLNEGIVTYVPTTDWNGEDSFTFKANDGIVDSNTATATITVSAVDDAPVVVDSTFVIDEDQVIDITLTASDVDDEDLFIWAVAADPSNGKVEIQDQTATIPTLSKTIRYTPNTNYDGTDSFTYFVRNQNEQVSNVATISFTINPVNDGPIANNLTMTVDEDWTGATVTIKGDNNGATDPEGDAITYYIVDAPSNGSIYNDAGGGIPDGDALAAGDELTSGLTIYNPDTNYNGTDTFTFKGNDGTLDGNTATVQITVSPVNDAPVTTDISATTNEDTSLLIHFEDGVNIIDIDNEIAQGGVTGSIVSSPANGNLYKWNGDDNTPDTTILTVGDQLENSAGLIKAWYVPNSNYNGTDTFTYKANDGSLDSNTSTATIIVNPTYGDEDNDITTTDIELSIVRETSSGTYINSHYDEGITEFDENFNVLRTFESSETQTDAAYEIKELSSGGFNVVLDCNSDGGIRLLQLDSGFNQQFITDCYMPDDFKGWSYNAIVLDNDEMVVVYDGYKDNGDEEIFFVHYNTDGSIKRSVATNMTDASVGILKDSNGFSLIGYDNAMRFDLDGNVTQAITNWASSLSNSVNGISMYNGIINSSDGGYVITTRSQQSFSRGRDLNFSNKKELFSDINNRSMDTDSGILLVKLNSDFTVEWETLVNQNSHYEAPRGTLLQDSDGSYYLTGGIRTSDSGYFWASLLKFDSSGNLEFYKEYGESDGDYIAVRALLRDPVFDQFNILSKRYVTDPVSMWLIKVDKDGTRTARTY